MIKISVIIPVYNTGGYVGRCLESVLSQGMEEIEILCIDDGSEDSSRAVLRQYAAADGRISVFHQPHAGVSAARNLGIEKSSGDYLLFVDSDDYLLPGSLLPIYNSAVLHDADAVIFGGRTTHVFQTDEWVLDSLCTRDVVYESFCPEMIYAEAGAVPFIWNKLFRRRLIVDHHARFRTDIRIGEDHLFVFTCFPYGSRFVFTKEKAYCYRVMRAGSAMEGLESRDGGAERQSLNRRLAEEIYRFWESRDFFGFGREGLQQYLERFLAESAGGTEKFQLFRYLRDKGVRRFVIKVGRKVMTCLWRFKGRGRK